MTPAEAIAQAKKGKLLPAVRDRGRRALPARPGRWPRSGRLRSAAASPAFNEDKFQAGEVDIDKVLSAARTVPMMAPKRFVLVRGVERWDSARESDAEKDDDAKALSPRQAGDVRRRAHRLDVRGAGRGEDRRAAQADGARQEAGVPRRVRGARQPLAHRLDRRTAFAPRGTRWSATSPSCSRRSRGRSWRT